MGYLNESIIAGKKIYTASRDNGTGKPITDVAIKENLHENPLATNEGQTPVSIAEPFEYRMSRLGLIKNVYSPSVGVACTQGSFTTVYTSLGSAQQRANYNIIPTHIIFSTTGAGFAQISYQRESGGETFYFQKYFPAAGAWEFKPEGQIITGDLGKLDVQFKADGTETVAWFNMHYAEVSI